MQKRSRANLEPLFFGRLTRILFGIGVLLTIPFAGIEELGVGGTILLLLLGISFLLGGILANPGCELTALPNLLLPPQKRIHFM